MGIMSMQKIQLKAKPINYNSRIGKITKIILNIKSKMIPKSTLELINKWKSNQRLK